VQAHRPTGWRCRLAGHRFRFLADGSVMRWSCERGCGAGGSKRYASQAAAQRYAAAFDREALSDLGHRAPLGMFPLRIARWLRRRSAARGGEHPDR
jgi:hypothetical protein